MTHQQRVEQGQQRRKAILKFLRTYISKNGHAPTLQEITDAVELGSANATRMHLQRLVEDGFIRMPPRISRSISLIEPAPDAADLLAVELYRTEQRKPWSRAAKSVQADYLERARTQLASETVPA